MIASSFSLPQVCLTALSLLICSLTWFHLRNSRIQRLMPPGPPGPPILGNILQISRFQYWLKFAEWRELYGNIFSLHILGQHTVVINDFATSAELLGRRSSIYSDRLRLIMANELLCNNRNPAFIRYGDLWRKLRKAGHEGFNARAVLTYRPMQEEYAARLVSSLLTKPTNMDAHIRRSAASTILTVIYGWPPLNSSTDSVVQDINNWVHKAAKEAMAGRLVEIFPWMLRIPAVFAPWKKWGLQQRRDDLRMFQGFMDGMEEAAASKSQPWAAKVLADRERLGLDTEDIAWLTGGFFGAGSETSSAAIRFFLLAMLLYPEVMQRAQQEIDAVVGRSRLPSFADEPSLPYISAIIKEILRWRPVAPIAIPRQVSEDDWYNGYFIPKGTTVIQNVWGMNHDPAVFSNPDAFHPERYLDETGHLKPPIPDTVGLGHASFGAGRRICCGKELAVQSLFINVASILWAADILPVKGADGERVLPPVTALADNGVVIEPAPFPCVLEPRAKNVLETLDCVIQQAVQPTD